MTRGLYRTQPGLRGGSHAVLTGALESSCGGSKANLGLKAFSPLSKACLSNALLALSKRSSELFTNYD